MPGLANLYLQIMIIKVRVGGPATKAWTICTERAGVCIFRPTLVCFMVASVTILSPSAMFELFLTFDVLVVSVELGVLSRKCEGTREYVRKPLLLPGNGGGSRIYSMSLML